jgi:hypothetical protein
MQQGGNYDKDDLDLLFIGEETRKKSGKKWIIAVAAVAVAAAVLFFFVFRGNSGDKPADEDTFMSGISIFDIDVSGMTVDEAAASLDQKAQSAVNDADVEYIINGRSFTITGAEAGAGFDFGRALEEAFAFGKSGGEEQQQADVAALGDAGLNFDVYMQVDRAAVISKIEADGASAVHAGDVSAIALGKSSDEETLSTSFTVDFNDGSAVMAVDSQGLPTR